MDLNKLASEFEVLAMADKVIPGGPGDTVAELNHVALLCKHAILAYERAGATSSAIVPLEAAHSLLTDVLKRARVEQNAKDIAAKEKWQGR